jgi:hypothetical protein
VDRPRAAAPASNQREQDMALAFYSQEHKNLVADFKGYMKDALKWNDEAAVGAADDVSTHATTANKSEEAISTLLASGASRHAMATVVAEYQALGSSTKVTLAQAIASSGETVVVLKGIHQKSNPHITVACGTNIYHLYVAPLGSDNTKYGVRTMSAGEDYAQLGWKKA